MGTELGPYRLTSLLGSGGMGMVFAGEHRMLGKRVAIKVLLPDLAGRLDIVQRFFKEARSVNDIAHENIVEIDDFVQTPEGLSYLVMEFLSGHDLGVAVANEGPFTLARSLHVVRQVAAALAAAHEKRIVHRDLKPENVFLIRRHSDSDFVKLLDFGLAKVPESSTGIPSSTQTGVVMGTPEYMSPEQAMGVPVDVRSDVYSLAVILYWLVAAKLPFEGDSFEQQRRARVSGPAPELPRTSAAGEEVPFELRELVARCLARPPEDRPQNCRELLEALNKIPPFERASAPPAPQPAPSGLFEPEAPPRVRPGRGRWLAAAAALLLLLAGVGGWLLLRPSPKPPPKRVPRPPPVAVAPPVVVTPPIVVAADGPPKPDALPSPPTPKPATPPKEPLVKTSRKKIGAPSRSKAKRERGKAPEPLLPFPE